MSNVNLKENLNVLSSTIISIFRFNDLFYGKFIRIQLIQIIYILIDIKSKIEMKL